MKLAQRLQSFDQLKQLILNFFVAGVIATLYSIAARADAFTDFVNHAKFAEAFLREGKMPSHPLFHLLSIGVSEITSFNLVHSGQILIWITVLITALLCNQYLSQSTPGTARFINFFVTIVMFLHPVPALFPWDHHLYLGYVTASTFHNPTIILLKPLAILHFFYLCTFFQKKRPATKRDFVFLFVITSLTILAKPSYIFTFAPTVGLFLVVSVVRKNQQGQHIFLYFVSLLLPTLILLAWQFNKSFADRSSLDLGAAISFSPFAFFRSHNLQLWTLFPKLLMSLLFPISLLAANPSCVKKDLFLQFSFINLFCALFFFYFIVETGPRLAHGNFGWSAQTALFLVNVVCLRQLVKPTKSNQEKNKSITHKLPYFLLLIEFFSGLAWFLSNILSGHFYP